MPVPLITVITPTYGRKDMFKQALGSLLMQNSPNLEITVSYNASTDDIGHTRLREIL